MKNTKQIIVVMFALLTVVSMSFAKQNENVKIAKIKSSAFTFEQKLKLENLIWEMDGIKEASYNTNEKELTVKFDENQVTTDMMMYSITNNLGYTAELKSLKSINSDEAQKNKKKENEQAKIDIDKQTKLEMNNMLENILNLNKDVYLNSIFA